MSGGLTYNFSGLQGLLKRIDRLSRVRRDGLLDVVGATVETQTRRRITDLKAAPGGEAWPAWSDEYAKRRPGGRSLLMGEDNLLDSVTFLVVGQTGVEVGSNLIYAATHQFGDEDRGIPARPYLGISEANEIELFHEVDKFLDRKVGL